MSGRQDFRVHILYGDDLFSIGQAIAAERARIRQETDPATADVNILELDASRAKFGEMESAVMVVSFFQSGHRLVVFDQLLKNRAAGDKGFQKQLLSLLEGIPPTTRVMIPIADTFISSKRGYELFKKTHFLHKWAEGPGKGIALLREHHLPTQRDMPQWIIKHAASLDGVFRPDAAAALAELIGTDTALCHQEILKVLTYLDFARPAEVQDVHELVSYGGIADIFSLVDSIGLGQTRTAQQMLHRLLEQQDPMEVFPMVVRQFRLLIRAREVLDQGGSQQQIAVRLEVHPFVAEKLERQARRYGISQLITIYQRLLEMDVANKSGGMPLDASLDLLIFDLSTAHR
ncbi:MAG: DNA polymerase III subunit delta [Anaerolineae bacterium]|nr:DNA polymerase III subunit delta [Anaerolineae bacterium]